MSLGNLRKLYPAPQWACFEQVRSGTGDVEDLTIADMIAVRLWKHPGSVGGLDMRYIEYKASADDLGVELRAGAAKSKLSVHCTEAWLAVSSRKVLGPHLTKIPAAWGIVDVGGSKVVEVRAATKREPEIPSADFLRALLRSATTQDLEAIEAGAPLSVIDRPFLSRTHVGLACTHSAPRPMVKDRDMPKKIPCFACAAGLPREPEVVEAMIEDASDDVFRGYVKLIERQMARRGLGEVA